MKAIAYIELNIILLHQIGFLKTYCYKNTAVYSNQHVHGTCYFEPNITQKYANNDKQIKQTNNKKKQKTKTKTKTNIKCNQINIKTLQLQKSYSKLMEHPLR